MIDLTGDQDPEEVPTDWWLERVRNIRNAALMACDWTQVADAPVDVAAWATYRQALRDFPATWTPGPSADLPDPPA